MTHATFTKLLVLVVVAFIMCLPEFFTSQRAPAMDFSCLLLPPCLGNMGQWDNISQMQQVRDAGGGPYESCVNISTQRPACVVMVNRTHSSIKWFLCETETDLRSFQRSTSRSEADSELSLEIQNIHPVPRVVNSSGLVTRRLLFTAEDVQQVFRCCIDCTVQKNTSGRTATSNIRSCCILSTQGTNSTQFNTSLRWTDTPKENWFHGKRALWLALILIIVLLVLGNIVHQVYWRNRRSAGKAMLLPVSAYQLPESQGRYPNGAVNAGITSSEILEEVYFNAYRYSYKRSTLSPIPEDEATDEELSNKEQQVNGNEFTELLKNQTEDTESSEV